MYNGVLKNYNISIGKPFKPNKSIHLYNDDVRDIETIYDDATDISEDVVENTQQNAKAIIEQAESEAKDIIEQAHAEKQRILSAAKKEAQIEADKIKKNARNVGYDEGRKRAEKEYSDKLFEAESIKQSSISEYNEVIAAMEPDIINLVLKITQNVLQTFTQENKEYLLSLIRQAVEKLSNKDNLIIKVADEDYLYVQNNQKKLLTTIDNVGEFEIRADSSLKKDSCKIETPFGYVDSSIDKKMEILEDAFERAVNN